jgi:thymidylate synthase
MNRVWLNLLNDILEGGDPVSPRGQATLELPQKTIVVNMRSPVLTLPQRLLNYRFMAAEAFWILTGDNRVETIAPYNSHISQFSDDGVTFFGAYGPKIISQLTYVVDKLRDDEVTRQAGLTLWRENPPTTKDVPCTIAIWFQIRDRHLNCHVFMRSSDVWLGIPYDVFNFSMLAHLVCARYRDDGNVASRFKRRPISPGNLYLTAASSHLYERNHASAEDCLRHGENVPIPHETPTTLYDSEAFLLTVLEKLRDSKPGDPLRWWEVAS